MTWDKLSDFIGRYDSFLLSSHLSLDGDCVGSQLAFAWYLESLGKKTIIFNQDPVPAKFNFLRGSERISAKKNTAEYDVLAVLDCSNPGRLGWGGEAGSLNGRPVINIDHHRDNTNFGTVNIVDRQASATGELLYRFFAEKKVPFPPEVAEALYTAILTDTGGFRFPNTTSKILHICADLAERGADPSRVYEQVYSSHSQRALLLQSRIWSSLRFFLGGKVCVMEMPLSLLEELGAPYSDSEGMADCTITAADVEVGILTKHSAGQTHFSLRSKGKVDVGKIAQKIPGGGGHSSAAGCTIPKGSAEAMRDMLAIIERELG